MNIRTLSARLTSLRALCVAALLPAQALAYHPLITDDTGTQGLGGNQLELGFDYARSTSEGTVDIGRGVPFTYTRGLTDRLDAFAGVSRITSPNAGWSNVGIGAKWRFYEDEASMTSLAIKPEIVLPVSASDEADGLGNGKTSYGLTLILTRGVPFGELHMNLAAERNTYADDTITDRRSRYRASIAPVWAVAEDWKLALDLGVQTNPDRTEKARMGYAELGVIYSPSKDLDLSLGIIRDLMDGEVRTTSATLGVTWRFQ